MKKDMYEEPAEKLLIKGRYKLINKNMRWMSHSLRSRTKSLMKYQDRKEKDALNKIVQITQDALSTTDFKKFYDNNLVS